MERCQNTVSRGKILYNRGMIKYPFCLKRFLKNEFEVYQTINNDYFGV